MIAEIHGRCKYYFFNLYIPIIVSDDEAVDFFYFLHLFGAGFDLQPFYDCNKPSVVFVMNCVRARIDADSSFEEDSIEEEIEVAFNCRIHQFVNLSRNVTCSLLLRLLVVTKAKKE